MEFEFPLPRESSPHSMIRTDAFAPHASDQPLAAYNGVRSTAFVPPIALE
jgi:hypothetical protein